MLIKKGETIQVDYIGTLDDGTVFDSSKNHGKPLEFEVGAKQLIKGFDEAVVGMNVGEEKVIHLAPEEAYGSKNPELVRKVPLDKLPSGIKAGTMLVMGLPDGQQMPAKVEAVSATDATLDLNHPLADKTLTFRIKVVAIV